MSRPLARYLNRVESRSILSDEERGALLAIDAPLKRFNARWDLVRPGDDTNFACLVEEGLVGRAEVFAGGSRNTTALYIPGDMADLHSVAVPRAAWVITALTDCAIYQVPHEALRKVASRYPGVGLALWRDTIADASIMSKWISVISRKDTRARIAHLLCEFSIRMGAAMGGGRSTFDLPLTHEQLSEVVGATTVHLGRIFKSLRDAGIVTTDRRRVTVLDRDQLARIAQFDSEYLLLDPTPT